MNTGNGKKRQLGKGNLNAAAAFKPVSTSSGSLKPAVSCAARYRTASCYVYAGFPLSTFVFFFVVGSLSEFSAFARSLYHHHHQYHSHHPHHIIIIIIIIIIVSGKKEPNENRKM